MYNLISAELFRLRHMLSFKILLISMTCVSMIAGFAVVGGEEVFTGLAYWYGALRDNMTALIFGAILAGLFIGSDFTERNMSMKVAAGHARIRILAAKIFVLLIGCCLLFFLYPVPSVLLVSAINGFGGTAADFWQVLQASFLSLSLTLATTTFFVFIGFKLKKTGSAVSVGLMGVVLLRTVFELLASVSPLALKIYRCTTFGSYALAHNPEIGAGQMGHVLAVALLTFAALFGLTWLGFRQDEIK